jgi:PDZ domain-containing protein
MELDQAGGTSMAEEKDPAIHEPYRVQNNRSLKELQTRSNIRFIIPFIISVLVIYGLVYVKLPYYIFSPGSAEQIHPMVQVKQGGFPEKGTFMLTTVSVREANVLGYLSTKINTNEELYKKEAIRQAGETDSEYNERQSYIMQSSQSSAIVVAYQKAGIPYHIQIDRVTVLQTLKGLPAMAVLTAGDVLETVDDKKIDSALTLQDYLKEKKAGDTVKIKFIRANIEKEASLTLALLPADEKNKDAKPRVGLGIVPANVQSIHADDENKQVTVKAGEIGGPSAGLMFSLEIYNQLVEGDITKGYRIAGTGTIGEKQNIDEVGAIGGIQHKIVAAEREGADYFFAPAENMKDAQAKADKIHAKMKLVSVTTMDQALDYLKALPEKTS